MQDERQELCICCGMLAAMTTEELRVISKAKQAPERLPRPWPETRTGLCNTCWYAGCDGVAPCKVGTSNWKLKAQLDEWSTTRGVIHNLERRWLEGQPNDPRITKEGREGKGDWVQVGDEYWRKEFPTSFGIVLAEMLKTKQRNGYFAQMRLVEASDPQWIDEMSAFTNWQVPLMPLSEALSECEDQVADLIADMITDGPSPPTVITPRRALADN